MAHPKPWHTYWLMVLFSILLQNSTIKVSEQVTATSLVYEGYPVQLQCVCNSYDTSWKYYKNLYSSRGELLYRNGNIMGRFRGRFYVDNNGTESLSFLINENVSTQDTGYYKCYCDDKNTVSEILIQVVPNGYPKCSVRSSNSKRIVEYGKVGQNVILTCKSGFDSNYPTMRWTREETQIPDAHSSNHITILKASLKLTENDEDVTYTCILGNGSVASAPSCSVIPLRYQPRVNINPKVAERNVGENVTFNCSVTFERNKPGLSHLIYDWSDTILANFSGRFVLDNENRSLQLFDLKYSDDLTELQCRVTLRRTGAQGNATAVLRVNETEMNTMTPPLGTYTSTQNYSTLFIHNHSTPVTLNTPPSTLGNAFHIYLGISLIIVFVGVIILSVYTLHKTRINSRSGYKTRVLSVGYEEIKPKTAIKSKSNGQIVCGIVGPVEGKRSSQYEEVSDYELNNVTFCGTDLINSEKCGRTLGVQKEDTAANKTEKQIELIKSDSLYAQIDEDKFIEIPQPLSDSSSGSATDGERTRDTSPVYATVNKTY